MPEPDPEQLLKMIDAQLAHARSQRLRKTGGTRLQFRVWSLVLILVLTFVALGILQFSLSQMLPAHAAQQHSSQPAAGR